MQRVSLASKASIARSIWSPTKSKVTHVYHYSIPNYDAGSPQLEDVQSIKSSKFLLTKPCVLISKLNPGDSRVWLVDKLPIGVGVCSTEFVVLIPHDSEDLDYLYLHLKAPSFRNRLVELATGTSNSHQRVRPEEILNQEVDWLDHGDSRTRRTSLLIDLEKKIALNRDISESIEAISQTIFKSWFIDFDPVHAKARREQPEGMDAEIVALFPDSFEESEIGPIPTGWSISTIGESSKLVMGQSPPGESYNTSGDGLPFYQGRTDFGTRFPSERVYTTEGRRLAKAGDTLVSVRAPVGDLNQALKDCVLGRGVAAIRHKSDSEIYTYGLIKSLGPQLEYFNGEGTVFGAINRKDFESLQVLEPSNGLVEAFERALGPLNALTRNLHEENLTLANLRDSLLPRLISGELEIPEELLVD